MNWEEMLLYVFLSSRGGKSPDTISCPIRALRYLENDTLWVFTKSMKVHFLQMFVSQNTWKRGDAELK